MLVTRREARERFDFIASDDNGKRGIKRAEMPCQLHESPALPPNCPRTGYSVRRATPHEISTALYSWHDQPMVTAPKLSLAFVIQRPVPRRSALAGETCDHSLFRTNGQRVEWRTIRNLPLLRIVNVQHGRELIDVAARGDHQNQRRVPSRLESIHEFNPPVSGAPELVIERRS